VLAVHTYIHPYITNNSPVNIYSHLLGALLFALLPIYIYCVAVPRMGDAKLADLVVFAIFFFGVACCFSLSSLYVSFPLSF
jgi:adiponectin receptor